MRFLGDGVVLICWIEMKRCCIECIFEFKYNLKLINILMGIFFSKNNGEFLNNNNFGEKNNYFEILKFNINVSF